MDCGEWPESVYPERAALIRRLESQACQARKDAESDPKCRRYLLLYASAMDSQIRGLIEAPNLCRR